MKDYLITVHGKREGIVHRLVTIRRNTRKVNCILCKASLTRGEGMRIQSLGVKNFFNDGFACLPCCRGLIEKDYFYQDEVLIGVWRPTRLIAAKPDTIPGKTLADEVLAP